LSFKERKPSKTPSVYLSHVSTPSLKLFIYLETTFPSLPQIETIIFIYVTAPTKKDKVKLVSDVFL